MNIYHLRTLAFLRKHFFKAMVLVGSGRGVTERVWWEQNIIWDEPIAGLLPLLPFHPPSPTWRDSGCCKHGHTTEARNIRVLSQNFSNSSWRKSMLSSFIIWLQWPHCLENNEWVQNMKSVLRKKQKQEQISRALSIPGLGSYFPSKVLVIGLFALSLCATPVFLPQILCSA